MFKIAICDDDKNFLSKFSKTVSTEFDKVGIDYSIVEYDNGNVLLNTISDFDLVFLDIDMPKVNGFQIAEKISNNEKPIFIFVTLHDELVYSSIKLRPFRFIRKSYIESELKESVAAAAEYLKKNGSPYKLYVSTNNGEKGININLITYIEVFGHSLLIHTVDEKIETYGSLLTYEKQLTNKGFVRAHKSYLVNYKFIYSVEQKQIIMDDKTIIPLSRYKAEKVRNEFKSYIRRQQQ